MNLIIVSQNSLREQPKFDYSIRELSAFDIVYHLYNFRLTWLGLIS